MDTEKIDHIRQQIADGEYLTRGKLVQAVDACLAELELIARRPGVKVLPERADDNGLRVVTKEGA
jgi:hypothetical protein